MSTIKQPSSFIRSSNSKQAKVRLLCFPYAGGSAVVYKDWSRYLSSSIEVVLVELPGRGTRSREALIDDLKRIIVGISDQLPSVIEPPFAFFGHSMGAVIAFEVARILRSRSLAEPIHLFVSGRWAPQMPNDFITHDLPYDEFIARLRELGGTPHEALSNSELMELILPILRADFKAIELYEYSPGEPLSCPISAFGGLEDIEVRREHLAGWEEQTAAHFSLHSFKGDHFFLHTARSQLLGLIERKLLEDLRQLS
jgi:medium-chain acyl-[acyl-carrier-protein] hydrolase